jgi:hypothetical protein
MLLSHGHSKRRASGLRYNALGHFTSSTDDTTYTIPGANLGPVAADRYIILAVSFRKSSTPIEPTSLTVDGVSAVALGTALENTVSANESYVRFWKVDLTSNPHTVGDIVLTLPSSILRCAIQWGYTTGGNPVLSGVEADDITPVSGVFTGTINVPVHGFGLATVFNLVSATGSITWTGLANENGDDLVEVCVCSQAYENFSAGSTGLTVTATTINDSGSGAGVFKAAAFVAA